MAPHRTLLILLLLTLATGASGPGPASAADAGGGGGSARGSGAVRPVAGAVIRPFEAPAHDYAPGHRGVDLAAGPSDDVRAALAGTVRFSGTVAGVGWVTLDHGGTLATTYGPLATRIAAGAVVEGGQVIGRLADDATHLDWGARIGASYIDPLSLLRRWRMRLTDAQRAPTGVPEAVAAR